MAISDVMEDSGECLEPVLQDNGTPDYISIDPLCVRAEPRGNLALLSWNVAGLSNKIKDPTFLAFIDNFNVICLQECWDQCETHINGYRTFFFRSQAD